jgi:hypothetical protein
MGNHSAWFAGLQWPPHWLVLSSLSRLSASVYQVPCWQKLGLCGWLLLGITFICAMAWTLNRDFPPGLLQVGP